MPYKVKGKCVYKKDTGKKVGCTKGPVKKYLTALNIATSNESICTFSKYFYLFEGINFQDLPEKCPYGFWVSSDKVIVVRSPGGHFTSANAYLLNRGKQTSFVHAAMFDLGFVRCVVDVFGNEFYIEHVPGKSTRSSIKSAEDIADFYNIKPVVTINTD
jgi:hypothetical protein